MTRLTTATDAASTVLVGVALGITALGITGIALHVGVSAQDVILGGIATVVTAIVAAAIGLGLAALGRAARQALRRRRRRRRTAVLIMRITGGRG